jgi:hypothetical protein
MTTSIATLQTIWDCRWSRLGRRLHGVEERQRPETLWVCARRPGQRRCVTEQECEECGFWETRDPDVAASSR